jgi:hypothetical protein
MDNISALSAVVHGYSGKPDMARLANLYNLARAKHSIDVWCEYVPSAENIADIPSKPTTDWSVLLGRNMTRVHMVLPSAHQWSNPQSILGLA